MVKLRIRNRLSLEEKSVRHRGVALRPAVGEILLLTLTLTLTLRPAVGESLLLTLTLTLTLRPAVGESLLQYSCDVVIPHPQDMVPVKDQDQDQDQDQCRYPSPTRYGACKNPYLRLECLDASK